MANSRDPSSPPGLPRGRSQWRGLYHATPRTESPVASSSSTPKTPLAASKFMLSMKRSLSHGGHSRKRSTTLADIGMHSTPEESLPPIPRSYDSSSAGTAPSIEQIAMGLHISRTPHLTPVQIHQSRGRRIGSMEVPQRPQTPSSSHRPSLQVQHTGKRDGTPIVLPPPPSRSSLKKPNTIPADPHIPKSNPSSLPLTPSASEASLSSLPSSSGPSTPRSNSSGSGSLFAAKLQLRMSKFLPLRKNSAASNTTVVTVSDSDSASSGSIPRKVVRFSPPDMDER